MGSQQVQGSSIVCTGNVHGTGFLSFGIMMVKISIDKPDMISKLPSDHDLQRL